MDGTTHKLTLIVKDLEARLFWTDTDGTVVATVAQLPDTYTGGHIGFFTYAHQAVFQSLKITDLDPATASSMPIGYCGGAAPCLATGVCGTPYTTLPPPAPAPESVDTVTDTCYFPKAGWCRGFDDCSVGYATSPASCWNKCYHKYGDTLIAIDLDEFNTDGDCTMDFSTDPPTQLCHCCCQDACPSCVGAGTETLIIRGDWNNDQGGTTLPATCGNPDTGAPTEYQMGNLDMANCANYREPQHHAMESVEYDPATQTLTVTVSDRDPDSISATDWCAYPAARSRTTAYAAPHSIARYCYTLPHTLLQDWHLPL